MKVPFSDRDLQLVEKQKEFFDEVAEEYVSPGPFKGYYNEQLLKMLRFNIPKGASVLELGCGLGISSPVWNRPGESVSI